MHPVDIAEQSLIDASCVIETEVGILTITHIGKVLMRHCFEDSAWNHRYPTLGTDPLHPYQGHYCGDEDTRRKVAYHNGTAWTWQMPLFPEAYYITHGAFGRATAVSLLSSMAIQLDNGCIMHMPEILDGDWPHKPRGCDAQAWGLSEYYRVWKLLHPDSKSIGKNNE